VFVDLFAIRSTLCFRVNGKVLRAAAGASPTTGVKSGSSSGREWRDDICSGGFPASVAPALRADRPAARLPGICEGFANSERPLPQLARLDGCARGNPVKDAIEDMQTPWSPIHQMRKLKQ
jgi:hypothetical protein